MVWNQKTYMHQLPSNGGISFKELLTEKALNSAKNSNSPSLNTQNDNALDNNSTNILKNNSLPKASNSVQASSNP